MIFLSIRQIFHAYFLFKELDDVFSRLEQLEQRAFHAVPQLGDTSNASSNEGDMGEPRRRLRSKTTYQVKKTWGARDVGQFYLTGITDVATKFSRFYCRIYRKDVSVLTYGNERKFATVTGQQFFPRNQHLKTETPSCEVLDYEGNAMSPAEVERQREKIIRVLLVLRDREYPFSEDVIVKESGAVDPNLGIMAKVSSLVEVLRQGGSFELV